MSHLLSLGAGKYWRGEIQDNAHFDKIVFVDNLYGDHIDMHDPIPPKVDLVGMDIFEFLELYSGEPFDHVQSCRVFEHIPYDSIPYLLYLIRGVTCNTGSIEVTVPDFSEVFKKVDNINPLEMNGMQFNRTMIDCHTELFNTPQDPHMSIWTPTLAMYYMNLEGFWDNINIVENVQIDNRKWYMTIHANAKV